MTPKQLEIISMDLHPTKKLFLIAMTQAPTANRSRLAKLLNIEAPHVSTVTKKMVNDGLINIVKVEDSTSIRYQLMV